jgi:hypothetical protein
MKAIFSFITKLLGNKAIVELIILLLEYLARNTKTTIDDEIVKQIRILLENKV